MDRQSQDVETMVRMLKEMAEQKATSKGSNEAPSSSNGGGSEGGEKAAKEGEETKEAGPKPTRWERSKPSPKPELVPMTRRRRSAVKMAIGCACVGEIGAVQQTVSTLMHQCPNTFHLRFKTGIRTSGKLDYFTQLFVVQTRH